MSTPADQNHSVVQIGPLDIDLSALLEGPGSTTASIQSVDGGVSAASSVDAGAGVELSIGAPGGIPQVSAGIEGGIAADGQSSIGGSYNNIDLTSDAESGTNDLAMQSAAGEVSGYGGLELEGGVGVDFSPVDAGIPEIGISGGVDFGSYGGYEVEADHDDVQIHQDGGDGSYLS